MRRHSSHQHFLSLPRHAGAVRNLHSPRGALAAAGVLDQKSYGKLVSITLFLGRERAWLESRTVAAHLISNFVACRYKYAAQAEAAVYRLRSLQRLLRWRRGHGNAVSFRSGSAQTQRHPTDRWARAGSTALPCVAHGRAARARRMLPTRKSADWLGQALQRSVAS